MPTAAKKVIAPRPIVREPMLLVFKEKHGRRYFHVADDKALFKAALHVLIERHGEGYWYPKPQESDRPTPPDVAEADIEKLPKSLQDAAKRSVNAYKSSLGEYLDAVEQYRTIEKAISEKDGRAAWEVLRNRRDAEYEGFELENYEEIE